MLNFNPSVLLLVWMALLLFLISLPWPMASLACAMVFLVAFAFAPQALRRLLRRSRWLLLAVLVMFGWMTPGMPVPWLPGATSDGLQQAAEQISRLVISLAMVAVLLSRFDTVSLLAACHGLLHPLQRVGVDVERLVLRLALTLHQLDEGAVLAARPEVICLPQYGLHAADFLLLLGLVLTTGAYWL